MERANGACPVGGFLDDLKESDRRKLDVIFERLGDMGHLRNNTKFKHVEKQIYEIKSKQIRIFCFFTSDRRIVLLHGVKKQRTRLARKHIDKAISMRSEFQRRQEHA